MGYKVKALEEANSEDKMSIFIDQLRITTSNNRNDSYLLSIVEKAILKCKQINDEKSLVKLYEIKISQIEHIRGNLPIVSDLIQQMKIISEKINYIGGLALAYYKEWFIEKLRGEGEKSLEALNKSMNYAKHFLNSDEYEYNVCNYSFAIEKWLSDHDAKSADILEQCSYYFSKNGFNRSYIQTIFMLVIIYSRAHKSSKVLQASRRFFKNERFFDSLPLDIKAIVYYSVGLGYMLELELNSAEIYFDKAYNIFTPIYKDSIYFAYYLVLHSHIVTVKALQGKLEQTMKMIDDVENLLQEEFYDKNLDTGTRRQICHTLNLNKFYVYSRLRSFNVDEISELIFKIFEGSKNEYSDFMLLSEFILNADLKPAKLKELLRIDNFSINCVKHLISYALLGKRTGNFLSKNSEKRIDILTNRVKTRKTTFIENVLADLLIAQQLHELKRYKEISVLLSKYEKQLNNIEVLELRLFMEAFIQIGAYRNGDPLGPVFQYLAIRKCRYQGFSRLESKLLDYLEMQKREVLQWLD